MHDVKYGFGFRRVNATTSTLWPGNGILSQLNNPTTLFAQVFREGSGTNRTTYMDFYVGDTISKGRATIDVGIRYDRQGGKALPSVTAGNPAFPNLVPGLNFAGYDAPFTWNNVSPRAGFTYALDEARTTLVRASYSRFSGQLDSASVGYMNPSSAAGVAVYRWLDLNSDHFAQADEVQLNQFVASGGGFNPRESDGGHLGEPNRSEPEGAGHAEHRRRARARAASEPLGPGELHLHEDDEPAGQRDVLGDAARRRVAVRLHGWDRR